MDRNQSGRESPGYAVHSMENRVNGFCSAAFGEGLVGYWQNLPMQLSIRTKLYLALLATVFLVTLVLLFFLQFSVDSFESYTEELDSRLIRQAATLLESKYEANGGENWEFIDEDLADWLGKEQRFSGGPVPVRFEGMRSVRNLAPEESMDISRLPPPPDFPENGAFPRPRFFESNLVLRAPGGTYIAGAQSDKEPSQSLELVHAGKPIGILELLPNDAARRFPSPFGRFPEDPDAREPFANGSYVSDLVSRARFMTLQSRLFFSLMVGSVVMMLLLGLPLAQHFTRRVDDLYAAANRLSQGDFNTRLIPKGKDELAQLAHKFNYLAEVLKKNKDAQQIWVSNISHELRTPLGILKGELEAIQDGVRKADSAEINMLHTEVEQLNLLVNDLFELSLSDLGVLNYNRENILIKSLIEDCVARFRDQLESGKLTLNLNLDEAEDLKIFGDHQRLLQLFSNLIQNSIKYTYPEGSIFVSAKKVEDMVRIKVEDSSPGVPEEALDKLFNRFYRVEQSRNRTTGGTGLGLAICRNITEFHQGTICANHSPHGGVSIELVFPVVG